MSGEKWEARDEFSPALMLFVMMFTRAQAHREYVEYMFNRVFTRCGKVSSCDRCRHHQFTGGLSSAPVKLCSACAASHQCICCSQPSAGHPACLCKSCRPMANMCAKCNSKIPPGTGSTVVPTLCSACGLGSRSNLCCRMVVS